MVEKTTFDKLAAGDAFRFPGTPTHWVKVDAWTARVAGTTRDFAIPGVCGHPPADVVMRARWYVSADAI